MFQNPDMLWVAPEDPYPYMTMFRVKITDETESSAETVSSAENR